MKDVSGTTELKPAGLSHRQAELEAAAGGRTEDGHDLAVTAYLRPVDDNPHDPHAVEVHVNERHVGFIPAEIAARWHQPLKKAGGATCKARLVGGWDRGAKSQGNFGLRLYVDSRQLDDATTPWWKRKWAIVLWVVLVLGFFGSFVDDADAHVSWPDSTAAEVGELTARGPQIVDPPKVAARTMETR